MPFSNTEKHAMLDARWGSGTPATRYFALFNGNPTSGGTEASGTGYARVSVTNNSTNFPAASGGEKTNGTAISFGTVGSGGWGTFDYVAEMSASSGGSVLTYDAITSRTPIAGDTVEIPAGSYDLTITD